MGKIVFYGIVSPRGVEYININHVIEWEENHGYLRVHLLTGLAYEIYRGCDIDMYDTLLNALKERTVEVVK